MKKTLPCYLSNPLEKITWWEHGREREMESEAQKQNWKKKITVATLPCKNTGGEICKER